MTERQIEERVKKAFTSNVPDNFDAILAKCENAVEEEAPAPKIVKFNTKYMRRIISSAAVVVIVLTVGIVSHILTKQDLSNPNGDFFADSEGETGSSFFDAAEDTTNDDASSNTHTSSSKPQKNDKDDKNNKKPNKNDKGDKDNTDDSSGVVSGTISGNNSSANASADSSSNDRYMQNEGGFFPNSITSDSVNSSGPTEDGKIGWYEAKQLALSDAGLTNDQIYDVGEGDILSPDSAESTYTIKFRTDVYLYKYTIDAYTGEVLDAEKAKKYIGFEKAKQAVLDEIGKSKEQITNFYIHYYYRDSDDYSVEIHFGKSSCEARVNAITGEVTSIELEGFEEVDSSETASGNTSSTASEDASKKLSELK